MSYYGIDVSYSQGTIDWTQTAAEVDFVIVRAGYGQNNIDAYAHANVSGADAAGLPVGLYWFSYAYTAAMAYNEGLYAGAWATSYHISMPIFWDFEDASLNYAERHGATVNTALYHDMADAFCRGVESYSFRSGLYYNPDFNRRFSIDAFFQSHPNSMRWVAKWSSIPPDAYDIWQYTDTGQIAGISGNVDLDQMDSSPIPPAVQKKLPLWMYLKLP